MSILQKAAIHLAEAFAEAEKKVVILRGALTGTTNPPPAEFLSWIADRLVHKYGEDENVDFVLALRRLSKSIGDAVEKTK
jgi:hypothetical protein